MSTALLRRPARAAVVVSLGLALAACGSEDTGTAAPAPPSGEATSSGDMDEGMDEGMDMGSSGEPMSGAELDRAFIAGMVPHHQSAADMAQVVVERGTNPEVRALAQRIIDSQGAEIATFESIAQERFDFTPERQMPAMTQEMMGMSVTMDMAAQVEMLRSSQNVDRDFLTMMIPHHASAITMADEELEGGEDAELLQIAEKIIAEQAEEIGQMQALLASGV